MANIDPLWWIALAAALAVVALGACIALGVRLTRAIRSLQSIAQANTALEQQMITLQEQTQRELLAMGQRVLAADKLLNRFGERVGRLENTRPAETQYGQLEAILTKVAHAESRDEVSVAEAELRSLLQQRTK